MTAVQPPLPPLAARATTSNARQKAHTIRLFVLDSAAPLTPCVCDVCVTAASATATANKANARQRAHQQGQRQGQRTRWKGRQGRPWQVSLTRVGKGVDQVLTLILGLIS